VDVPAIQLHGLRRTHATILLPDREPVSLVSQRLGHAGERCQVANQCARASSRRGPVGIAPRLKTGSPIARMSAVSRCSPQITMPSIPAAWASGATQVTGGCFIQAPAVVDYQHVARCCRFECLQESIDAVGMPGGIDTTGQAAARHHGTQSAQAQRTGTRARIQASAT
jgi:hypothetical protein